MKKTRISPQFATPHDLDGRLPLRQAIPLGLQHVLAMFVGNLSPLLILMAVCGITVDAGYESLRVSLLQNAMLIAGIVTFLQLYPIGPIGGRLPIVMGTSSGFIGVNKAIAVSMMAGVATGTITTNVEAGIYAYGAVMGASLIGGVWEMILGFLIKPLRCGGNEVCLGGSDGNGRVDVMRIDFLHQVGCRNATVGRCVFNGLDRHIFTGTIMYTVNIHSGLCCEPGVQLKSRTGCSGNGGNCFSLIYSSISGSHGIGKLYFFSGYGRRNRLLYHVIFNGRFIVIATCEARESDEGQHCIFQ